MVYTEPYCSSYLEVKLASELHNYLQKAEIKNESWVGKVKAIIGPHAGFQFSGPVAAWSYKYM